MNDSLEIMLDLFALSGGFWMIFGLCTGLSIQRFIIITHIIAYYIFQSIWPEVFN